MLSADTENSGVQSSAATRATSAPAETAPSTQRDNGPEIDPPAQQNSLKDPVQSDPRQPTENARRFSEYQIPSSPRRELAEPEGQEANESGVPSAHELPERRPAEVTKSAELLDKRDVEGEASVEQHRDASEAGSTKRKADQISDLTAAEVRATKVRAATVTREHVENVAVTAEVPQPATSLAPNDITTGRSFKRLRSVAEAAGYVALGGAAAGVAFVTTLIVTAPDLA